ncbi:putative quinol monooxygenase [Phaeocystidibacter marisrubri]|uniref:Antibiotic biosynthesis monooxygenase n=1 Tax=Phaeocystidibacter marisrubri TaxID=1577780 RepID=A0A6L3ZIE6_9FLAO|nr:antibiotic biosynthesis monooxygenase family protein [Phaeocystidibacter marisrubri]KAB2816950.1 antibiotic biosynthesis monooxygenase [Phaeocystidibacter marisrubri]GGH77469.1 antibiotic biosynthesis monooxygenase [Phaeocystidibacter marisrubri]
MNRYLLHGKLRAQEGKGHELSQILLRAADMLQSANGCQLYAVSVEEGVPDDIWITEIWDTKEDHDNSLKSVEIKNLISTAIPLLAGNPEGGLALHVIGGLGVQ